MRSLFQTRFPRFYRKRSVDRDVSARATHLKAAMENVFMTTTERKRMSTKTTFKRIALVAVAALGLGVLSVAPSTAANTVLDSTFTIDAATDTGYVGETTTAVLTHTWNATAGDSVTVSASCLGLANTGGAATCPTINFYIAAATDTANVNVASGTPMVSGTNKYAPVYASTLVETATSSSLSARSVITARAVSANSDVAGTYTYTIRVRSNMDAAILNSVTWTVTLSAANTTWTGLKTWMTKDVTTGTDAHNSFVSGTDSTVAVTAGVASNPTAVAYIYAAGTNSLGETKTATAQLNVCTSQTAGYCAVTATISGPGLIAIGGGTRAKTAAMTLYNGAINQNGETLVVYSDGTPGTGTITFYNGGATLATKTVTFFGSPASAVLTLSDTSAVVANGNTGYFSAAVKDSALNSITSGSVYIYSSDTAVISESATACSAGGSGSFICGFTAVDTGTATIVVRDSSTVSTSTWASAAISVRVSGSKIQSITASFDKATYAPGEKAILTITAKDRRGGLMDGNAITNAFVITPTTAAYTLNSGGTGAATAESTFTPYLETGVETRVIYMPSSVGSGKFDYKIEAGTGSWVTVAGAAAGMTAVTASATIADPTKDAADAATDAALEATDAAYAAQDAAQLAAEAADAATAAAEAATAAVEDLATQVASLFADLQKQITTLANVVAKIAKKVKA